MNFARLDFFATTHHGLVTRRHALQQGWSRSSWYRAIDGGDLLAVAPDVARIATSPATRESRILAPILSIGPTAKASHRSGAHLWGVTCPAGDPIDIVVTDRRSGVELPDVIVHRPRDLVDLAVHQRSHIPTVSPLRVLIDLGAVAPERVAATLEQFVINGLLSPGVAQATLDRHSRPGRQGATALRAALDDWRLGATRPDRVLETAFIRLATDHGLPDVTFHARLEGIEVDFHFPGTRLVVECDGWIWHGVRRDQFELDRERDAILGRAGYVVRRFTWTQIQRRPSWVAKMIRESLSWMV